MAQHNGAYWLSRFDEDRQKLKENQKKKLITTLLIHMMGLTDEEVELFLRPKEKFKELEDLSAYAVIEAKTKQYNHKEQN